MPAWAALGLLESLWHWVGRYRPSGLLTSEDLLDVSDEIRCNETHVAALVEAGWLDDLGDGKFYIHDWHDHADDTVKKTLQKRGEAFANGADIRKPKATEEVPNDTRTDPEPDEITEIERFANDSRTIREPSATSQSLSQSLSLSLSQSPQGGVGEDQNEPPAASKVSAKADGGKKETRAKPKPNALALWELLPETHQTQEVREALKIYFQVRQEKKWGVLAPVSIGLLAKEAAEYSPSQMAAAFLNSAKHQWRKIVYQGEKAEYRAATQIDLSGIGGAATLEQAC